MLVKINKNMSPQIYCISSVFSMKDYKSKFLNSHGSIIDLFFYFYFKYIFQDKPLKFVKTNNFIAVGNKTIKNKKSVLGKKNVVFIQRIFGESVNGKISLR